MDVRRAIKTVWVYRLPSVLRDDWLSQVVLVDRREYETVIKISFYLSVLDNNIS